MLNTVLSSIAILSCLAIPSTAQPPENGRTKFWTAPLTQDGHPDLQGVWLNKSATPLERPKELEGREFLTDEEVVELRKRAERIFSKDGRSDFAAGDGVFLAALSNAGTFRNPNATGDSSLVDREFDNRTSLIIDPTDGKLPPYTPLGQQRRSADLLAIVAKNAPIRPQDLILEQRCISFGNPRLGGNVSAGNFGFYQIFQTGNYVVFYLEAIHDARIIPLDGRPHLPSNIRTWEGDSRGHWEGNTLVVDTTNFAASTDFLGAGEDLHLTERFTRIADDEIRHEITIDAPATWTNSWTVVVRLRRSEDHLFEFACHEGNGPIMETMLSGEQGNAKYAEPGAKK